MMNITSYTFQSPYPNQIQIGRPDPQTQQQNQQSEGVGSVNGTANKPTQEEVDAYLSQARTGASVNVASSTLDMGVDSALSSFSAANNQVQAVTAYSS